MNVPGLHEKCYNLLNDYNDDGSLKSDAKPKIIQYTDREAMLEGLNKKVSIDTEKSWPNLKAYIRALRDALSK